MKEEIKQGTLFAALFVVSALVFYYTISEINYSEYLRNHGAFEQCIQTCTNSSQTPVSFELPVPPFWAWLNNATPSFSYHCTCSNGTRFKIEYKIQWYA